MSSQNESPILLPRNQHDEPRVHAPEAPTGTGVTAAGIAVKNIPDNAVLSEGGILLTKTQETSIAVAEAPLSPSDQELTTAFDRETLYFMSRPLDYLESKLQKHHLDSPMTEIRARVTVFDSKLPQLTKTERTLLRSPLAYIRQSALEDLAKRGIGANELQDIQRESFAPQIVDASTLQFSWPKTVESLPPAFFAFLTQVMEDQLPERPEFSADTLKHFKEVFSYLEMITETFQYRHQTYKLVDDRLMDVIAQRLEPWAETLQPGQLQHPGITALFDWLSHFDIGNTTALKIFQKILHTYGENHPLRHQVDWQLQQTKPETSEEPPATPENVGIEIEGIPMVFLSQVPSGFWTGKDGGMPMPEIRRKKEKIPFDAEYKRDLFELWYWAKMSKFQGVSVHFHFDILNSEFTELADKFGSVFGKDFETIRVNKFDEQKTIEIRLNLSSYGLHRADLKQPFFADQFNLILLIEELIRMRHQPIQLVNGEVVFGEDQLPVHPLLSQFWKMRFQQLVGEQEFDEWAEIKKRPSEMKRNVIQENIDKLLALSERDLSNKNPEDFTATYLLLESLPDGSLDPQVALQLMKKFDWDSAFVGRCLQKIKLNSLTSEQFMHIGENAHWDGLITEWALLRLNPEVFTLELISQLMEKLSTSPDPMRILGGVVSKIPEPQTTPEILLKIMETALQPDYFSQWLINELIEKFPTGSATFHLLSELMKKNKSNKQEGGSSIALERVITRLPAQSITLDYFRSALPELQYQEATQLALKLVDESVTTDFIIETAKSRGWRGFFVLELFEKLSLSEKTAKTVFLVGQHTNWEKNDLIKNLIERMPKNTLSENTLRKIVGKLDFDFEAICCAWEKLRSEQQTLAVLQRLVSASGHELMRFTASMLSLPDLSTDPNVLLQWADSIAWSLTDRHHQTKLDNLERAIKLVGVEGVIQEKLPLFFASVNVEKVTFATQYLHLLEKWQPMHQLIAKPPDSSENRLQNASQGNDS